MDWQKKGAGGRLFSCLQRWVGISRAVLALSTLLLWGCANAPAGHPAANTESEQTAAQQLASGQQTTITTSQGNLNIKPTIVAVPASSDSATDVTYDDPLEGFNRAMFAFNNGAYRYVLIPVADGYKAIVPGVVRDKIGNAFDNIREPLNVINNTFSGNFSEAGTNLGRFVINSTVGLLGLFDPADAWFDLKPHKQTLSDMLRDHDVTSGAFIVLPILGPSDVRGTVSTLTEGVFHPLNYVTQPPETYQLRMVDGVDDFSLTSDAYQTLYEQADDPYVFFRNQYIQAQRRDKAFEPAEENDDE